MTVRIQLVEYLLHWHPFERVVLLERPAMCSTFTATPMLSVWKLCKKAFQNSQEKKEQEEAPFKSFDKGAEIWFQKV